MLAEIDSRELAEWMAYDRIDPIGDLGAAYRTAILCQQVIAPYLKDGAKMPGLHTFMPFADQPEEDEEEEGLTGEVGFQVAKQILGG